MDMDIKDKIEALRFLSQTHRAQVDERRKYEWRIVFATITFYIMCVSAAYSGKATIPNTLGMKLGIWIMFLGLAIAVIYWLHSLHIANNINKTFAERAEGAIDNILTGEKTAIKSILNDVPRVIGASWAWKSQIVTISFFAFASILLLILKIKT